MPYDATTIRRTMRAGAVKLLGGTVGARQLRVVATDATPDRAGDVVDPAGGRLENFKKNPVILAEHNPAWPIARCSYIGLVSGQILATIDFPAEGTSEKSDEYLRLAKAGVIGACSIGFLPIAYSQRPDRNGGLLFSKWELLELSLCAVPCHPGALVIDRSFKGAARQSRRERAKTVLLDATALLHRTASTDYERRQALAQRRRAMELYPK